ncbi:MAG: hypothetical protein WBP12_03255 [Candidatus Saccharimonas sp.]
MKRYELVEEITIEDSYPDLPKEIDQIIVYLSADALTHAIRQMRARDPLSPHLEYLRDRLSITRKFSDPNHVPLSLADVIAMITNELRDDLSPEERRMHIQDSVEFMKLNSQLSQAYKYN